MVQAFGIAFPPPELTKKILRKLRRKVVFVIRTKIFVIRTTFFVSYGCAKTFVAYEEFLLKKLRVQGVYIEMGQNDM
jgi:hypothetical protein